MNYAVIVPMALQLAMDLVKAAREAKMLSDKELADIKADIDKKFENFPTWDELE